MALDFFAGCVGGCAAVLVGYPFDTVKVRLQTQDSRRPKYKGTIHCFSSIIRKESVAGLYKGMTSPLAGVAFINALIFGVYGNVQRSLPFPESLQSIFVAGATAGLSQSFICCPMELVKLRMQIQEDSIRHGALSPTTKIVKRYQGPMDCVRQIHSTNGVRGFFQGFGITALREAPAFGIYFASYEFFMSCFQRADNGPIGAFPILMAGGLSGIVSWVFTYPLDVVKTRIQVDGENGSRMYSNMVDCTVKSYKAEGYKVFFKGIMSTIVRAFPTNAATFVVVSWTFNFFNNKKLATSPDSHKRKVVDGKKLEDMKPMSEFNTIIA